MQLDSSFSRICTSWIVPESTALNVIKSPDSLPMRTPLAFSTSYRVGNLGESSEKLHMQQEGEECSYSSVASSESSKFSGRESCLKESIVLGLSFPSRISFSILANSGSR